MVFSCFQNLFLGQSLRGFISIKNSNDVSVRNCNHQLVPTSILIVRDYQYLCFGIACFVRKIWPKATLLQHLVGK